MLPFDADALFAGFAAQNADLWPAPLLALMLAAGQIVLAVRPLPGSDKVVGNLLAAGWLWVGLGWHVLTFADLNFAAPLYGAAFVLQGVLLAWATRRGRLAFGFRPDLSGWAGLMLAVAAVALYPLADRLGGQDWAAVRVVGLAPCPTALLTLGLLLLAPIRKPLALLIIPALWTLVAGFTGWILGLAQDAALPLAGIGALTLAVWSNRRAGRC